MAAIAAKPVALAARPVALTGVRAQQPVASKPCLARPALAPRRAQRATVQTAASAVEVAQLAGEAGYIFGVSGVMCGITLIGLAFGFVLLRVESLVEEGKI